MVARVQRVLHTRGDTLRSSLTSRRNSRKLLPNVSKPFKDNKLCSDPVLLWLTTFPQLQGRFVTKIFHPHVSSSGEICVNTLKKDWQSSFGIAHILVTVKCLLIYPNPESALDEEAGRALLEDYEQYCMRARTLTSVHAMMKVSE